ncbi:hypothetical protein J4727_08165 [Providencia rettgeri]|uniref:Uncharacterized protein n=1 Tax=Providencia rettgeri TaxID=587 RepID=A0A939NAK7_PRORE|nr:hypothetical protein [Providencia rettgeri]
MLPRHPLCRLATTRTILNIDIDILWFVLWRCWHWLLGSHTGVCSPRHPLCRLATTRTILNIDIDILWFVLWRCGCTRLLGSHTGVCSQDILLPPSHNPNYFEY